MEQFETNEELIYSLIIEDLEQTISETDKRILEEWRSAAEGNEQIYKDFAEVQLHIDKLYGRHGFDPQASWDVLNKKLITADTGGAPVQGRARSLNLWYKVAAAVLVVLSVGYYFISRDRYVVVDTTQTETVSRMVLPDGTELNLNSGTKIKYDRENFIRDRKLVLEGGEVFVHVTNHSGSQFRIDLGDVEVRDIGTSFNVTKHGSRSAIVVEEGKVAMKDRRDSGEVLLTAGMLGIYNSETKQLSSMDNADLNYKAWMDKKFTFREVPFGQVTAQLEKVYKIPLIIRGDELRSRKLTAKLHYQTLDSVLEVISASLQCKVVKEQNAYVLSAN